MSAAALSFLMAYETFDINRQFGIITENSCTGRKNEAARPFGTKILVVVKNGETQGRITCIARDVLLY